MTRSGPDERYWPGDLGPIALLGSPHCRGTTVPRPKSPVCSRFAGDPHWRRRWGPWRPVWRPHLWARSNVVERRGRRPKRTRTEPTTIGRSPGRQAGSAPLAQSAEHSHGKAGVVGSIPTGGSTSKPSDGPRAAIAIARNQLGAPRLVEFGSWHFWVSPFVLARCALCASRQRSLSPVRTGGFLADRAERGRSGSARGLWTSAQAAPSRTL